MTKKIVLILLIFLSLSTEAQMLYKSVKLDIGLSMGEFTAQSAGFVTPYAELKYNLNNHFTLGGRAEFINFSKKDQVFTNNAYNELYWENIESDGYVSSVLLTGDYNFTTKKVRPFIGGGFGMYYATINEQNVFVNQDENFIIPGAMVRTGFSISHFKFAIEYNHLPNDIANMNYLSFKLGFEIGGGKKLFFKP